MDGTSVVAMSEGMSKRWSTSDLISALPLHGSISDSTSRSSSISGHIRLSPASSTTTSRAPSPTPYPPLPPVRNDPPPPPSPSPSSSYRPFPSPRISSSHVPSSPLTPYRYTPSSPNPHQHPTSSRNLSPSFAASFSRRLSKPVIEAAYAAATPSTYILFIRGLHPSLLAYFIIAVSAVISNKSLLRGFLTGMTYALTAWQMACATLGTMVGERLGIYRPVRVAGRNKRVLVLCALVFSLEILTSNLALRLVPVPFHVSVRACSPILTLFLSVVFFNSSTTLRTSASLLVVVLGAALTSHHEEWVTTGSLLLVASAVLLTAKSLLVTHLLTARLALHPIDILARLSPLSMLHCALFAVLNGEVSKFASFLRSSDCTRAHLLEIALNGVLAFMLVPLASLAEKKSRAPALQIASHAAQATTIVAALLVFGLRLSFLNFIGVALVLGGGVIFATYEARDTFERGEGLSPLLGEGMSLSGGDGSRGLLPTMNREKMAPD